MDAYRPISFFAENGAVEFLLHSSPEFDKNTIKGGVLTCKMIAFKKEQSHAFDFKTKLFDVEQDSLWNSNNYFSKEVDVINEKIKVLENGEELNRLYRMRDELLETQKGYTPITGCFFAVIPTIKRDSKVVKMKKPIKVMGFP